MALSISSYSPCEVQRTCSLFTLLLASFLLLFSHAQSISFNFSSFQSIMTNFTFEGDTFASNGVIQLTKNQADGNLTNSKGRASFAQPVRLWDAKTQKLTDFTTNFTFTIFAPDVSRVGDGLAFFVAPFDSNIPNNSFGGYLGLFSFGSESNTSRSQLIAVEFDTFENPWDPSPNHLGINIGSIVSAANVSWNSSMKDGTTGHAWISYNSTTKKLSVFLTYNQSRVFDGNYTLSYMVDLREVLPEKVRVGFSAATGDWVETHNINSWSFSSSLEDDDEKKKSKAALIIGLTLSLGILTCGLGLLMFVSWKRRVGIKKGDLGIDMDDEFLRESGPKRFSYQELARATNNFDEGGKLGEGGFGGVFKGLLSESKTEVAVKRVSRDSKQGQKEYVSEVKIISRLRHRNLVQLIGWCHERGEFLLVYEFMPNGSLDTHLFGRKEILTWTVRYKIVTGLASALLYLHEEWEQCVVHRDIKSSNVMLDLNFNAKLGDFGLARLVDHDLGSQTTVLAGTMGYLAPECVTTGKASKESDVYSFGVVSLEIACGRRPVQLQAEPIKMRLIEWVWDLYGNGLVLEAADKGLRAEFDERQMECLLVVGLWCCHPDYTIRPSIKQVINVLNFEAPLPCLPSKLPVPMYYAPPLHLCKFSYTSSGTAETFKDRSKCSCSSCSTFSSLSAGSGESLLHSHMRSVQRLTEPTPALRL